MGFRANFVPPQMTFEWLNFDIHAMNTMPKEFLTYNDGSQTSYENRLTYFAFQFGKDIQYLSKDKLWLPIESFQFERNFGLANQGSFLFEIPKENIGDSLKISIDSKIYSKHFA